MKQLQKRKQSINLKSILLFLFIFFCFVSSLHAMDISLQWTPNSEPDVAGYKVYYREQSQSYNYNAPYWETIEPKCTIYDMDIEKTYYFVVRAFDNDGFTSDNSNEVMLREGTPINSVDNEVGSGGGGGGCFIATAAYGSLLEPHVRILCKFRDQYLLTNGPGKTFVKYYYKYSPPLADFISENDGLRAVVCVFLLPLVGLSWMILKLDAGSTMLLILLIGMGLVYLARWIKNNRHSSLDEIQIRG
ncbi:MAG: fibronectin type III domain-containing protein [Desulfobacteraceae bacterium]|nr:fibronectin type III domain-containing protein [Desulfobacteraceae bacterium]